MASCGEAMSNHDGDEHGSEVVLMDVSQPHAEEAHASQLREGGQLLTDKEHRQPLSNQVSDSTGQGKQSNRNLQGPDDPVAPEQGILDGGRESAQAVWQNTLQSRVQASETPVHTQGSTGTLDATMHTLNEEMQADQDWEQQQQQQLGHGARRVELVVSQPHSLEDKSQPVSASLPSLSLHPQLSSAHSPSLPPPAPPVGYVPQLQLQQKHQCDPRGFPEQSQSQPSRMLSAASPSTAGSSVVSSMASAMVPPSSLTKPPALSSLLEGQSSRGASAPGSSGTALMQAGYLQGVPATTSGLVTLNRSPMPGSSSSAAGSLPLTSDQGQSRMPDPNRHEGSLMDPMPKGEGHSESSSWRPVSAPLMMSTGASSTVQQSFNTSAWVTGAPTGAPVGMAAAASVPLSGVETKPVMKASTLRPLTSSSTVPTLYIPPQQQQSAPLGRQQSSQEQPDQQPTDATKVQDQCLKVVPSHQLSPLSQHTAAHLPGQQPQPLASQQPVPPSLQAQIKPCPELAAAQHPVKDLSEHLKQDGIDGSRPAYVHGVQAAASVSGGPSAGVSTMPQMQGLKTGQVQGPAVAKQQQVDQQAQTTGNASTAAAATSAASLQQKSTQLSFHQQPMLSQLRRQGTPSQIPDEATTGENAPMQPFPGHRPGGTGSVQPQPQLTTAALGNQQLSVGLATHRQDTASVQTQQQLLQQRSVKQQQAGLGLSKKLFQVEQQQPQQQAVGKADQQLTAGLKVHGFPSQGQDKPSEQPQVEKAGEVPKPDMHPQAQGTPRAISSYPADGFQGLSESMRDQQQGEAAAGQRQPQHGVSQQQGKGLNVSVSQQARPVLPMSLSRFMSGGGGSHQQHKQHPQHLLPVAHPSHASHQKNPRGGSQGGVGGAGLRGGIQAGGQGVLGTPQRDDASQAEILGKRSIQELLAQIDPRERLDPDVEDVLLEIADDFIETTTTFACALARHRKSTMLEAKDILLHLERNWHIVIPGFAGEEYRPYRRAPVSEAHKHRLSLVRKSQSMHTHHDGTAGAKVLGSLGATGGGGGGAAGVTPSLVPSLGGGGGGASGPSAGASPPGKSFQGGMGDVHTSGGAVTKSLSPAAKVARLS
ncbi:hypothetical protein CBR_g27956 [Chara braunii]|uniref:Transcription initiation factor TFIID subunit 12 domain-containing protein n=1 Tax=Chara braunii TaxID=69332 RepID=A0A388L8U9_CHABU|nr:hypothetical protein CBR_g27956 [Chara braunii]|eukprot:GBG78731.1 hypothetical protein CBR_g27956 [Chara braunii]